MLKTLVTWGLALFAAWSLGARGEEGAGPGKAANQEPSAPVVSQAVPVLALPDFTALVRGQGPAVVNVRVFRAKTGRASEEGRQDRPLPTPPRETGLGSGFVVSPNGVILTNGHVVAGAEKLAVRFADKRELPARIVGVDPLTDVAVLKVEARNLPVVTLGDSSKLEVGQWVLAIGAPLGLERTATQGIISALGRTLPNDSYVPFIQTDVPINQGNSGGPLFDLAGRVVGINAQIISSSGGYMGLSFAIPINTAVAVAKQIVEKGKATHGWLGVSAQELTLELAQAYGLEAPRGALVTEVRPSGPAQQAGLQPGDIILALDDFAVVDSADLPPLIGASRPGSEHMLVVLRDGRVSPVRVKVGELGSDSQQVKNTVPVDPLDVKVSDLDAATLEVLGLKGGVLVEDMGAGPAAEAGVRAGDILLRLGGQVVENAAQLRKLSVALPPGVTVPLLVKRQDSNTFVPLTIPKPE
ncbi:MAG: trypsin-like peptidase domain-containing protein [Thiobacillus sp.]|nr:trypsin-like peptidase domain-containing protein [Thiobacillus sp.]